MPISIPQVLDLLMALVLIMFIPIGLWRGALREWIALAGITFGYLLAGEWALAWGSDLAHSFGYDPKVAAFAVAAAFFLGVTLLVGYGGGVTLPYRPDLSWSNRILGALLSLGNGMLILSGTLRIMDRYLFDSRADSPLHQSRLAGFLIDYIGLAELGLLALFLCCLVVGLLRRWTSGVPLMEEYAPAFIAPQRPSWQEEPDEEWVPAPPPEEVWQAERSAARVETPPVQQTTVLPVTALAPSEQAVAPIVPAMTLPPTAPAPPHTPHVVEIARPALRSQPPIPMPIPAASPARENGTPDTAGEIPGPDSGLAVTANHSEDDPAPALLLVPSVPLEQMVACPVCGTDIAPRARFCMKCGHVIGTAEHRKVTRLQ